MARLRTYNRRAMRKQPMLRIRISGVPLKRQRPIVKHLRWDVRVRIIRETIARHRTRVRVTTYDADDHRIDAIKYMMAGMKGKTDGLQ